jgi:hypothetical protein
MSNCGLRNALREFHGGVVPNTHMRGSKQIDFVLTTSELTNIIEAICLVDCSVLNSDNRALFVDVCIEDIFGPIPEKLAQPQYRNLKLDNPRISDEYRRILHKQFEYHNIYDAAHSNVCRKRHHNLTRGEESINTMHVQRDHRMVLRTLSSQCARPW